MRLGVVPGAGDGLIQPLALCQPVVLGVEAVQPITGRDARQQIGRQQPAFGADGGEEVAQLAGMRHSFVRNTFTRLLRRPA